MAPTNNLLPHISSESHLGRHLCTVLNHEPTRRLVKEKNTLLLQKGKYVAETTISLCANIEMLILAALPRMGWGLFLPELVTVK